MGGQERSAAAAPTAAVTTRRASVSAAAQATVIARRAPGTVGACGMFALALIVAGGSPAKMLDAGSAWVAGQAATGSRTAVGGETTLTTLSGATGHVSQIAGLAATGIYR